MKTIFNIFSKKDFHKATKVPEKLKMIIDYREKNSLVISELTSMGIEIEFKNLKVGDYIVRGVVIERKTVSDFISSMINRRLFNQLEELQQYEDKLLVVEGIDEQDLYTDEEILEGLDARGLHPNAIRGFLLSIALKFKVPIIFTKNYIDTARFISVLLKKKDKEISLNAKKKSFNKKEQMQFIIESFPGIGPKTSKKLLKEFKTIRNIMNASEEDLKKVVGKKASIIKKIIDGKY